MLPPLQEVGARRRRRRREDRLTASAFRPSPIHRAFREQPVSSRSNCTLVSHLDCPGGGQVWVEGTTLYIAHMHSPHGTSIVDVADPRRPRVLATIDIPEGWHSHKVRVRNGIMIVNHEGPGPAFPHPTHTCLPIPQPLKGRNVMVVADEDVAKLRPSAPSFAWIYDITVEQMPLPIATFQVPGLDRDGSPQPAMSGCHQPSEHLRGTVIPFAWL